MIHLTIQYTIPSGNEILGRRWGRKSTHRAKATDLIVRAVKTQKVNPDGSRFRVCRGAHAFMTIVSYRKGTRPLDQDNLYMGAKMLVDALVAQGFAVDDSGQHMTRRYYQAYDRTYPRTEIRITYLPEVERDSCLPRFLDPSAIPGVRV